MEHYSKEFKLNAVKLVLEAKQTVKSVGEHYGFNPMILYRWIDEYNKFGEAEAFCGAGNKLGPQSQIRQLERKLAETREALEALKKTKFPWLLKGPKPSKSSGG
jgi:transposase-like protein